MADGTATRPRAGARGAPPPRKLRLGEYLLDTNAVNEGQLREALRVHTQKRCSLGDALMSLGYADEELLSQAVAHTSGLEYVKSEEMVIESGAGSLLPGALARRHTILPVRSGEKLHALVERPLPPQVVKSIERLVKKPLSLSIASRSTITEAMARVYSEDSGVDVEGKTAIELVDEMIGKAVRLKASDIHLEPYEHILKLRFRVDGILQEVRQYPLDMLPMLTSRIKVMSGMNIAERRSPQDGAFVYETRRESIDLRVSSLPCIHGEKIVIRILAGQGSRLTVDQLGLSDRDREWFDRLICRPHGIFLIVGPTGSGKSTTLCAALNSINAPGVNITTVEDPVEYKIEGINQVQVNRGEKITFAAALRSILRQDPDIIMVGETRDMETASISLRASLTGHLVFTTLHTNDAPGALPRLVDMGCEPFLVGSSVSGVLAQRLLRRLCPKCRQAYTPNHEECRELGVDPETLDGPWYRAKGCPSCMGTGYRGRIGVFELLVVDDDVRAEVLKGSNARAIGRAGRAGGMTPLRQDGIRKVLQGITSVDEVVRTTIAV